MVLRCKRIVVALAVFLLLAAMATAAPCVAAENVVGVIMTGDIPYYHDLHKAFIAKLGQLGLAADIEVIVQKPYPDKISLINAARKLIAMDVDAIVVYGTPAAIAFVAENSKLPVVYASVYEPFATEVKTRYTTGVYVRLSISSLLRYLKSLTQINTLGVVYNANEEDSVYQYSELSKLAAQQGLKIEGFNLKRHQEAKAKLAGRKADALFITGSAVAQMAMPQISEYAKEQRIPYASFFLSRDSRSLIALAANPDEQGEKVAEKLKKILDGIPPEKVRPEASKEVELIFNLKDATAMGLKLSMELVTEATKLIK
jgi:ABC-type uncharacterized transport system substrate-binding protein